MSNCKSCGAPIVWVKTTAGRNMPCDPAYQSWADGTVVDEHGIVFSSGGIGYRPHWALCPDADRHRSPQRSLFGGDSD